MASTGVGYSIPSLRISSKNTSLSKKNETQGVVNKTNYHNDEVVVAMMVTNQQTGFKLPNLPKKTKNESKSAGLPFYECWCTSPQYRLAA
jgi:hypothetical protein